MKAILNFFLKVALTIVGLFVVASIVGLLLGYTPAEVIRAIMSVVNFVVTLVSGLISEIKQI